MAYTVKEFAALFGVSPHTVRYYTNVGLLPTLRDGANRRILDDESVNWMQGIMCLKGCGASIEDIREYCALCLLDETEENLRARYRIILQQREKAHERLEEAQRVAAYMDEKVLHYEDILAGRSEDDSNPAKWTPETRPAIHAK